MQNKRVFNAETKRGLSKVFSVLSTAFVMNALADEVNPSGTEPTPPVPNGGSQINYEQLIAQARKEEKDKLYPQIEKLKSENANLVSNINNYLLKIGDLEKLIEKLQNDSGESEKDQKISTLTQQVNDLTTELNNLKESVVDEQTLRQQIEQEYESKYQLDKFRDKAIADAGEDILPVFVTEITGTTEDEIKTSIESAKKKTFDTKKSLGLIDDEGNPVGGKSNNNNQTKSQPTPPPAPAPSSGGSEKFDAEYVRNLDPRSPEYAEWRKKMGLK